MTRVRFLRCAACCLCLLILSSAISEADATTAQQEAVSPEREGTSSTASAPKPIAVTVGAFITAVPCVDLVESTFTFDAYVWFRWDPAVWPPEGAPQEVDLDEGPAATVEVIGAGELEKSTIFLRPGYCCIHLVGKRLNRWDVRGYPFDNQTLNLVLEDSAFDTSQLVYLADTAESGISDDLGIMGARVHAPSATVAEYVYPTSFGDPMHSDADQSAYSRFTLSIPVQRDGLSIFFKLFSALFISCAIAMCALFIVPTQVDPRFGLGIGGLFGIVASNYAVTAVLPDTSGLCYADVMHMIGLLCVLVIIFESTYSLSLHLNHGEEGAATSKKLDRGTAAVLAVGMVALWASVTYKFCVV